MGSPSCCLSLFRLRLGSISWSALHVRVFALASSSPPSSTVYVLISYRLFHLTNDLKTAVVPSKCNRLLLRNSLLLVVVAAVAGGAGLVFAKAANDVL